MRGFACIGLHCPKTPENVGGVLRAAGCYGVSQVNISGVRGGEAFKKMLRHGTNTSRADRHAPVFHVGQVLDYVPAGATTVAVELTDRSRPLQTFCHPQQAFYVFGPEDGSIDDETLSRCDAVVQIPTRGCMNLASTVCVVLYDRMVKNA